MPSVSLAQAKAKLSQLIDQVEAGEELVITRHGRPVAKVTPVRPARRLVPPLAEFRADLPRRKGSSALLLRRMRDEEA